MSLMKNTLLRINDTLYRVCIGIAGLSVLIMTLIIPWGIFARYILGSGSSWPEPTAILLMVVFTFFGAAASYRAGAHMAVSMAVDRMPQQVRRVASVVVQILMAIVALFMIFKGFKLCATTESIRRRTAVSACRHLLSADSLGGLVTLVFVPKGYCWVTRVIARSCVSTSLKKAKVPHKWTLLYCWAALSR